jgi:hypothetical protein
MLLMIIIIIALIIFLFPCRKFVATVSKTADVMNNAIDRKVNAIKEVEDELFQAEVVASHADAKSRMKKAVTSYLDVDPLTEQEVAIITTLCKKSN